MHGKIKNTNAILISIAILCIAAQSAQSAPIVSFEPSHHNVLQGDLFTMNITVDPQGVETMGAQYYLYFNNTMLNATQQIEGIFLSNDGTDTLIMPNRFNNTIGLIEYGETRIGVTNGVTSPGILATITFLAKEPGILDLEMSDVVLSDPEANEIPGVIVTSATVNINETHFDISGYVDYDNGDPVLCPDVMVTNLNTSEIFIAQVNDSSNYYFISTNFAHISSDHVLHFDASDDLGNSSSFDYTVTHVEMGTEGFVQNITFIIPDTSGSGVSPEHVYTSCNWDGTGYDTFTASLTVSDDIDPQINDMVEIPVNVYIAGDAIADGKVNILDATLIGVHWGDTCTDCWGENDNGDRADLNNDCKVNILDAVIIGTCWGHIA